MADLLSNISVGWLYYAVMAVYAFTVLVIIIIVLSENRSPVKSLAWVTVLVLMPFLGIVLYLFFGRSIKNTRMISKRNRRRLRKRQEQASRAYLPALKLKQDSDKLIKLTRTLAGSAAYGADSVDIFTDGASKFKRLIEDIESAAQYINLQYYIIEDDQTGWAVHDALVRKARSGVKVRLIYDHVGSFMTKSSFFKTLIDAGVEAYPFFKVVFPPFGTRINWRNHRKICIIDGRIGYIGGMNIAHRYIDGGKEFGKWRDTHLRITGPAVASLQYSFTVDWNFMGQPLIEDQMPVVNTRKANRDYDCVLQLITSGPTAKWTNIALLFVRAIASAKHRIYLQTPYFLPTEGLLNALQAASLSGVEVCVMMPKHSDSHMLDAASASYVNECLHAGITIYFYMPGMLHAKMLLVDYDFVSVGSTNFDFRSFEHNFEANMQIYSKDFNRRMAEIFNNDIKECQRVNPSEWKRRPVLKKGIESVTRLLSPIL